MRSDTLYKRSYNEFLRHLPEVGVGHMLGSERVLTKRIKASRTTVRKCLVMLTEGAFLSPGYVVRRLPRIEDFYPEAETMAAATLVEREFLKWILQSDSQPGQVINASRLARDFGVSTTTIREFLQSFQHFGLLERQSGSGWVFRGMTLEFAQELSDIREIFELRSVLRFIRSPPDAECWRQLRQIRVEHVELLASIAVDFHRFSWLDEKLHRLINNASTNRFVTEFYQVISLIFFYHYQWNKRDERDRNEAATYQHLAYIDAILARDEARVIETCTTHLKEARRTLIESIEQVRSPTNDKLG